MKEPEVEVVVVVVDGVARVVVIEVVVEEAT